MAKVHARGYEYVRFDDITAPEIQSMNELLSSPGLLAKQHTSQFCRCCCLQPNIDWDVHALSNSAQETRSDYDGPAVMHIKEDAPYIGRCCSFFAPGSRPTTYNVLAGPMDQGGKLLMTHSKPWTCGQNQWIFQGDGGSVRIPCCCCLPYLDTKDAGGNLLGSTKYICDAFLCVPKYHVRDAEGNNRILIRSDTCCGGCCMKCECHGQGRSCFKIPYYLRDPLTKQKLPEGSITDLWAGWAKECCTQQNYYSLRFPTNSENDIKLRAILLGAILLLDITMYEQEDG